MDVLTLHIGHPKTGTTSLQATFRDNAAVLARHGLFYYGATRTNHPLARPFSARTRRAGEPRIVKDFLQQARASGLDQAVVSSETLIRLSDEEAAECALTFGKVASRVRVLLYVRDPVGFAISAAAQGVRTGQRLADVAQRARVLPLSAIVERWRRAVGAENLTVRPYDRAQLAAGDVIDDVLATLGVPGAAPELTRAAVNEGLSVLAIHLLDRALDLTEGRAMPYDQQRAFNHIGGPRYVIPEATQAKVRRRAAAEVAFLREEFGIVLPDGGAAESPPPGLAEDELRTLAEVLHEVNAFAFRLDRSVLGRVLQTRMPYSNRPGEPVHPMRAKLERHGLLAALEVDAAGLGDSGDGGDD